MPEYPDAGEFLTMLRTAERLLREQANRMRHDVVVQPDDGNWTVAKRYRKLLAIADAFGALAAEIAAKAERR